MPIIQRGLNNGSKSRFFSFANCGKVRHTFQNEPLVRSPRNRRGIGNETTRDRKLEVNLMSLSSTKSTRKSALLGRFLVYSRNAKRADISSNLRRRSVHCCGKTIEHQPYGACNLREEYLGSWPGIIDGISQVEQEETHLSLGAKETCQVSIPADTLRRDVNTRKWRATENENFSLRETP